MNKGVGATLTSVILLFSLGTAGFFGIIMSGSTIERSIKYNTGDYNKIMEAKLKSDAFEERMLNEMNYTMNAEALERTGGTRRWTPGEIPTTEEVLNGYRQEVRQRLENLQSRTWCSQPTVESFSLHELNPGLAGELSISSPRINCTSDSVSAAFPVNETLRVGNPENIFPTLAEKAVEVAEAAKEVSNDREWDSSSATGTSSCEPAMELSPAARGTAILMARNKLQPLSNIDLAKRSLEEVDIPGGISVESSTEYGYNLSIYAVPQRCSKCNAGSCSEYYAEVEKYTDNVTSSFTLEAGQLVGRDGTEQPLTFSFEFFRDIER